MKLLQSLFICLILSFGIQQTSAQVYRFKTSSLSVMKKDDKTNGENGPSLEKPNLLSPLMELKIGLL